MNKFSEIIESIKEWLFIIIWAGGFLFSGLFVLIFGIVQGIRDGDAAIFFFMLIFGVVFTAIGGIGGYHYIKPILNRRIKKEGYAIKATVSKVIYEMNVYINDRHPGYLVATAVNISNETVTFKSNNIGDAGIKAYKEGDTVTVYVLDATYEKYEFDYDEISAKVYEIDNPAAFTAAKMAAIDNSKNVLTKDYNEVFQNANKSNDFSNYNKIKEEQNNQN